MDTLGASSLAFYHPWSRPLHIRPVTDTLLFWRDSSAPYQIHNEEIVNHLYNAGFQTGVSVYKFFFSSVVHLIRVYSARIMQILSW